jgi:hypothetical protein
MGVRERLLPALVADAGIFLVVSCYFVSMLPNYMFSTKAQEAGKLVGSIEICCNDIPFCAEREVQDASQKSCPSF